ncbi:MAG: response regulator transcription factor [Acidobacteriaceae bacterium]|nr:response regulator transcription factor [Acidobacteriaceae bacterium]
MATVQPMPIFNDAPDAARAHLDTEFSVTIQIAAENLETITPEPDSGTEVATSKGASDASVNAPTYAPLPPARAALDRFLPRSIVLDLSPSRGAGLKTSTRTMPIRVLVGDAHPIVLTGLRAVLKRDPAIQIVGEAVNEAALLEKAGKLDPDVVLMDFDIAGANRLSILHDLRSKATRSKTLLFTSHTWNDHFVEAIRIGCSGIVLKENATAVIAQSIHAVQQGGLWLDLGTTAAIVREFAASAELPTIRIKRKSSSRVRALSNRERDLILFVAMGKKNKEIAERMSISEQTVKNQLHSLCQTLGVYDRLGLVLYAISTRCLAVAEWPEGSHLPMTLA